MKVFIILAVDDTIMPRMTSREPKRATYLRPRRSERDPTKGHTPARASRFARMNQIQLYIGLAVSKE